MLVAIRNSQGSNASGEEWSNEERVAVSDGKLEEEAGWIEQNEQAEADHTV